jgi:hypothetical protein
MSELAEPLDPSSPSTSALMRLLETLDGQEVSLSVQRRLLHDRIDQMQVENGDTPEVAALQAQERALSSNRLELHQRIIELRIERSRRIEGLRANLHAVDGPRPPQGQTLGSSG